MQLSLGHSDVDLSTPIVMGVLNVTPDSFSDGGHFVDIDTALRHAAAMLDGGARIIDVGGESTRPGAAYISEQRELDRVIPVIERIHRELDVLISVDTSKPAVMRSAVEAGASIINDVYALRQAGALAEAANLEAAVCIMHMQGEPGSMQQSPHYADVAGEVLNFLSEAVAACKNSGIRDDRIVVDPGFGFGKTDAHNLELLANLRRLTGLGLPLLVGLSRKRTLGNLIARPVDDRQAAGLAAAVLAVERGANIVRTHDVSATVDALKVAQAVKQAGKES